MIKGCITFAFLRSVIGPENSRHSFDQSDAKLTPTVVCVARDFPRFGKFGRFYCEFPLAPKVFSFYFFFISLLLICRCGYFGFGFTTLGQKARDSSTDTHHTSNDELTKVLKSQSRKLTK